MVRWVHSVVREEWTAEVFDVELLRYTNIEEEMVEMLQIGLACGNLKPQDRHNSADVFAKMIQDIMRNNINKLSILNQKHYWFLLNEHYHKLTDSIQTRTIEKAFENLVTEHKEDLTRRSERID